MNALGTTCRRWRRRPTVEQQMNSKPLDEAEAHTLAKHRILQEYLKGWLPILGQGQKNRLLYFDGFAGCGELTEGHPGSPIVAIPTALQAYAGQMPLELQMVEKNADKCEFLGKIATREKSDPSLPANIHVHDPVCGECEEEVTELLDD